MKMILCSPHNTHRYSNSHTYQVRPTLSLVGGGGRKSLVFKTTSTFGSTPVCYGIVSRSMNSHPNQDQEPATYSYSFHSEITVWTIRLNSATAESNCDWTICRSTSRQRMSTLLSMMVIKPCAVQTTETHDSAAVRQHSNIQSRKEFKDQVRWLQMYTPGRWACEWIPCIWNEKKWWPVVSTPRFSIPSRSYRALAFRSNGLRLPFESGH